MANICAVDLLAAAKELGMTKEQADQLVSDIESLAKDRQKNLQESELESLNNAVSEIVKEQEEIIKIQERQLKINLLKEKEINNFVEGFDDKVQGWEAYLGGIRENVEKGRVSVDLHQKTRINQIMDDLSIELTKRDVSIEQFYDRANELNFAKEMATEGSTGDLVAKNTANAVRATYDKLRKMLNKAGAFIGDFPDYLSRQFHDSEKLLKTSGNFLEERANRVKAKEESKLTGVPVDKIMREKAYTKWRDFTLPLLDQLKTFRGVANVDKFMRSFNASVVTGTHFKPQGATEAPGLSVFTRPKNLADILSAKKIMHR